LHRPSSVDQRLCRWQFEFDLPCSEVMAWIVCAPAGEIRENCMNTNASNQPLAAAKSTFNFMKQFSMFATLALASGGSAPSR
jgi:hypothetical protein